ncbi:MAG: CHAP domain-containing protein [Alphaproteobacteria bacterium]
MASFAVLLHQAESRTMTDSRPTPRLRAMPRLAALAVIALAAAFSAAMAQAQHAPVAGDAPAHVPGEPPAHVAAAPARAGPPPQVEARRQQDARAQRAQAARQPAVQPPVPSGRGQCVAYVHAHSAFRIQANAHMWWTRAAGIHARGSAPEAGSVLSFRSVRGMSLGHVALVSRVVDSREIEIDQNNWLGVGPARGASVIDVSPNNDWTAVRVENRPGARVYGRVYPTDGFIHARAPGSEPPMVAARQPEQPPRREPLRAREPG